ncbi:MAG: hypothetical protein WC353_03810 [Candidatus Peribacter sp.]|jgi:hypothetical protein
MSPSESTAAYQGISYDDLLMYAIWLLSKEQKAFDWEDIVAYTFELFPKRFGLPHYENKYPDSSQVDRSILRCRDKGCLKGKRGQGYTITNTGMEIVESVQKKLIGNEKGSRKEFEEIKAHKKSKAGKMISHIKVSEAFKKFNDDTRRGEVSEYDICSMLFCRLDAAPETRIQNLNRFKDEAEHGGWKEIALFLHWVETNFARLFRADAKQHKGIYG